MSRCQYALTAKCSCNMFFFFIFTGMDQSMREELDRLRRERDEARRERDEARAMCQMLHRHYSDMCQSVLGQPSQFPSMVSMHRGLPSPGLFYPTNQALYMPSQTVTVPPHRETQLAESTAMETGRPHREAYSTQSTTVYAGPPHREACSTQVLPPLRRQATTTASVSHHEEPARSPVRPSGDKRASVQITVPSTSEDRRVTYYPDSMRKTGDIRGPPSKKRGKSTPRPDPTGEHDDTVRTLGIP